MYSLSAAHVDGNRYVHQNLHYVISILSKVDYPDKFLTMACSCQRPKIKNELLLEKSAINPLDLTESVFHTGHCAQIAFVIDWYVIGVVEVHDSVIGFQKQRLFCVFL